MCQAKSRRLNLEAGWAWTLYGRVCSQPGGPAPPPASGQRGVAETPQRGCGWFCCRVRLALLQGLSQLPGRASQADCLPCTEEGRLLSGLISCQLSVFFLCFCCSLRQTDGVGRPEKQDFQSGALLEQGSPRAGNLHPRPCTFGVNTIAQAFPASAVRLWPIPKSAHRIVCPGPSAAISYLLGSPPHMETLHVSPPVPKSPKTMLNRKPLGMTLESLRSLASAAPSSLP